MDPLEARIEQKLRERIQNKIRERELKQGGGVPMDVARQVGRGLSSVGTRYGRGILGIADAVTPDFLTDAIGADFETAKQYLGSLDDDAAEFYGDPKSTTGTIANVTTQLAAELGLGLGAGALAGRTAAGAGLAAKTPGVQAVARRVVGNAAAPSLMRRTIAGTVATAPLDLANAAAGAADSQAGGFAALARAGGANDAARTLEQIAQSPLQRTAFEVGSSALFGGVLDVAGRAVGKGAAAAGRRLAGDPFEGALEAGARDMATLTGPTRTGPAPAPRPDPTLEPPSVLSAALRATRDAQLNARAREVDAIERDARSLTIAPKPQPAPAPGVDTRPMREILASRRPSVGEPATPRESDPLEVDPPLPEKAPDPAARPSLPGATGRPDVTFFQGRPVQVRYRVVEASELQPSFDPATFSPNPAYPAGVQMRSYEGELGKAARDQVLGQDGKVNVLKVLDPGRNVSGPPVILGNGTVIAGNQRTGMLRRMWSVSPENAAQYRAQLEADATVFGVDPAALRGLKEPVLVREIVDPTVDPSDTATLRALNVASDSPTMKAKDPVSEANTRAAGLRDSGMLDELAERMEPEETLAAFLDRDRQFFPDLVRRGVIPAQELARYFDGTRATAEGKTLAQRMVQLAVVPDARIVQAAPGDILRKIESAAPALARVAAREGWSLTEVMPETLELLTAAREAGLPLEAFLTQGDMLGRTWSPEAQELAGFLADATPTQVKNAAKQYASAADQVAETGGMPNLLGELPPTPAEARAQAFRRGAVDPWTLGSIAGSGVGGAAGAAMGETPEERLAFAGAGMLAGAGIPAAAGRALTPAARNVSPLLELAPAMRPDGSVDLALADAVLEREAGLAPGALAAARNRPKPAETVDVPPDAPFDGRAWAEQEAARLETVDPSSPEAELWNPDERRAWLAKVAQVTTRAELRQAAIAHLLEGTPRVERQAVIIMGPPASGKSARATPAEREFGARLVDSDEVKKLLPEFDQGLNATAVHEESATLADEVFAEALARGENVVHPIVGRNPERVSALLDQLQAQGYTVRLEYIGIPIEEAARRATIRFAQTGRFVDPSSYILGAVRDKPLRTFQALARDPRVAAAARYDNNVPRGTAPIRHAEPDVRDIDAIPGAELSRRGAGRAGLGGAGRGRADGGPNDPPVTATGPRLRTSTGPDGALVVRIQGEPTPQELAALLEDVRQQPGRRVRWSAALPDGRMVDEGEGLGDLYATLPFLRETDLDIETRQAAGEPYRQPEPGFLERALAPLALGSRTGATDATGQLDLGLDPSDPFAASKARRRRSTAPTIAEDAAAAIAGDAAPSGPSSPWPGMQGTHSISLNKFERMLRQGGVAAPSIGVQRVSPGTSLPDFGPITLIARSKAFDPDQGAQVFDRDIFSPTKPATTVAFEGRKEDADELITLARQVARDHRAAYDSLQDRIAAAKAAAVEALLADGTGRAAAAARRLQAEMQERVPDPLFRPFQGHPSAMLVWQLANDVPDGAGSDALDALGSLLAEWKSTASQGRTMELTADRWATMAPDAIVTEVLKSDASDAYWPLANRWRAARGVPAIPAGTYESGESAFTGLAAGRGEVFAWDKVPVTLEESLKRQTPPDGDVRAREQGLGQQLVQNSAEAAAVLAERFPSRDRMRDALRQRPVVRDVVAHNKLAASLDRSWRTFEERIRELHDYIGGAQDDLGRFLRTGMPDGINTEPDEAAKLVEAWILANPSMKSADAADAKAAGRQFARWLKRLKTLDPSYFEGKNLAVVPNSDFAGVMMPRELMVERPDLVEAARRQGWEVFPNDKVNDSPDEARQRVYDAVTGLHQRGANTIGAVRPSVMGSVAGAGAGALAGPLVDEENPLRGAAIGAGVGAGIGAAGARALSGGLPSGREMLERTEEFLFEGPRFSEASRRELARRGVRSRPGFIGTGQLPPRGQGILDALRGPSGTPGRPPVGDLDPRDYFNVPRLDLPPELADQVARRIAELAPDVQGTPKRVVTWDETRDEAARILNTRPETLRDLDPKRATGPEILAVASQVKTNLETIDKLSKQLADPSVSGSARVRIHEELDRLDGDVQTLLAAAMAGSSEQGRALNANKILANLTTDPTYWLVRAQRNAGDRPLTPDERTAIVKAANEGNVEELTKRVAEARTAGPLEQIAALRSAGLLTGIRGRLMDVTGNTLNLLLELGVNAPARAMFDYLLSKSTGVRTAAGPDLGTVSAAGRGALEGVKEAGKALGLDVLTDDGAGAWAQFIRGAELPPGALKRYDVPRHLKIDLLPGGRESLANRVLDTYYHGVLRGTSAGDKIAKGAAYRGSIREQARIQAAAEGLVGKKAAERVAQLERTPTDDMIAEAVHQADVLTFQDDGTLATMLSRGVAAAEGESDVRRALFKWILPFRRTPSNIAERVADYTPAGFIRGALNWRQAVNAAAGKPDTKAQRAAVEALSRATTGMGLLALGAMLADDGLVTGAAPTDQAEREAWRLEGKEPNSILLDGEWRPIGRFAPGGNVLALGATLAQANAKGEAQGATAGAGAMVGAAARTVLDQPMVTGLKTALDFAQDPAREGGRFLESQAGSAVPTIVGDAARMMGGGVQRQPDGILEAVQARIPGKADELPARRTVLGDPIRSREGLAGWVSPIAGTKDQRAEDPVIAELSRVGAAISSRKRGKNESAKAYEQRVATEGAVLRQALERVTQSPAYQRIPAAVGDRQQAIALQRDMLEDAVRQVRRALTQRQR